MKKYWQIFKTSWASGFVYRLNFVMWRVRVIIQFLTIYFLWLAIFSQQEQVFGYNRQLIFTYILGTAVLRSFVLSSRCINIGVEIASGDLNNYLVKPLSYLKNWFARDLSDKLLNLIFMTVELGLILLVLRPPLVLPTGLVQAGLFLLTAGLAVWLYFFFSFLVSSYTFWYPEHDGWPLRFVVFMVMEFLAGVWFPLDIFPPAIYTVFKFLPTSYFLFYPMQLFLGRLSPIDVWLALGVMLFWLWFLYQLVKLVWRRGLISYGAYGR